MSPSTLRAAFAARVRQFLPLGFGSHVRDALTTHQPPTTCKRNSGETPVLTEYLQTCRRSGWAESRQRPPGGVRSSTKSSDAGFEGMPRTPHPVGRPPPPARPHVCVLAPPNHSPSPSAPHVSPLRRTSAAPLRAPCARMLRALRRGGRRRVACDPPQAAGRGAGCEFAQEPSQCSRADV